MSEKGKIANIPCYNILRCEEEVVDNDREREWKSKISFTGAPTIYRYKWRTGAYKKTPC